MSPPAPDTGKAAPHPDLADVLAGVVEQRRIRAEVIDDVAAGRLSFDHVVERAGAEPLVAKIKLLPVVEAVPAMGKVTARRLLGELGAPAGCRLGALAGLDDLSTRLSGALSDAASTDAAPPAGGNVFVVSGPGGAGKGTVVERLVADDPRLALSRSWTTRPRRPSESDDAYVFVSDAEFDDHVSAGGFLEWAEFLGHRYGTPNPQPPHGCDLLLEIDVQGAEQIRAENPSAVVVMVLAPSRREQERRMRGRGDPDDVVEARLAKSDDELAAGYAMADLIVVNDDVAQTADDIRALVDRTRNERDRRR